MVRYLPNYSSNVSRLPGSRLADGSAPRAQREAAPDCLGEAPDDLLELGVGRNVRWGEENGIALDAIDVAARGVADEAILEGALADGLRQRALGRKWGTRRAVGHELDADQEAAAANIAHGVVARERRTQRALEFRARGAYPLEEPVPLDDGLHRDSRGARRGVSAEGVAGERPAVGGLEHRGDRARIDGGAEGHIAPREALRHRHDVGHHAILLERAPGSGPTRAAHHLIGDEQHAVAAADLAHALRVPGGRRHGATGSTHHGLEDEGGDVLGSHAEDLRFELRCGVRGERVGRDTRGWPIHRYL